MASASAAVSRLIQVPVPIQPVRASFETNRPLEWTRVHDLPDFVYFDHSIHVQKGVGCSSCHGRIDRREFLQFCAATAHDEIKGKSRK